MLTCVLGELACAQARAVWAVSNTPSNPTPRPPSLYARHSPLTLVDAQVPIQSTCRLIKPHSTPILTEGSELGLKVDDHSFVGLEDSRAFSFNGTAYLMASQGVFVKCACIRKYLLQGPNKPSDGATAGLLIY